MTADQIRAKYLKFFADRGHKVCESDSLVPKDDPTVLFTPAGMNQFKKQFLGMITDFTRAASSQRCLRTDDLDKVGKTDCHHTFFEMLGNFSFGDYFKRDAIIWGWEFLTKELGISPEKLWISVYKDDDEAYDIWRDVVHIPERKIVRLGDKDNFWPSEAREKGPNGPCGPCSEIFFDLGAQVGCGKPDCSPACSCGRFIEVWNLVFTQFNRKDGGVLEPLPQKNIDTGMGLERITAVMQGVRNNFETDLFAQIIKEIKRHCDPAKAENKPDIYAIADHIRAVAFSIYDGILPSNEGRGYVVRKLVRKSVLHCRSLGIKKPFLYELIPLVAEAMKGACPDFIKRRENISDVVLSEEKNFIVTLNSSDSMLEDKFKDFVQHPDADAVGALAFQLYDTYGIPLLLTQAWLSKHNIAFSQEAFDRQLNEQKNRSKAQSAMQGDVFSIKELALKDLAATVFVGYEQLRAQSVIVKILIDSKEAESVGEGQQAKLVLETTPFYAESGGQAGDTGTVSDGINSFEVTDTQKAQNVFVHIGRVKQGTLKKGQTVVAAVERGRRLSIARNHTATHLLQAALRKVLGAHVQQQGSQVDDQGLRFDFTHFKELKKEELDRVEELVNRYVTDDLKVEKEEMSLADARQQNALAFFAEKYEERVRVVSITDVSKEFCGGTHLDNTGIIGAFKIVSEGSVASGVRRIEACTGFGAYATLKADADIVREAQQLLKTPRENVGQEIEKRLKIIKDLEKELSSQRISALSASVTSWIAQGQDHQGKKIVIRKIEDADMELLRRAVDLVKQKDPQAIVCLGSTGQGKVSLVVANTQLAGKEASAVVKEIAPLLGGSGGGRKDFAQAGGTKPENLDQAFERFKQIITG